MTELLTAAQMRAIEQAAIASGQVTGLELMERAGRGVVSAIFAEWPELAPSWGPTPKPPEYLLQDDEKGKHRAVVLCGPGNNGGDGFVVARLLKEAGWEVEVFLYGDAAKLPPDAQVNYERWAEIETIVKLNELPDFEGANLLIDALFGTGLVRALPQVSLRVANELMRYTRDELRVCAVDMPSGICSDSGSPIKAEGQYLPFIYADLTVTFGFRKIGHYLSMASAVCRKVVVKDIGLNRKEAMLVLGARQNNQTGQKANRAAVVALIERHLYTPEFMQGQSILDKDCDNHKYSHGHALILSGGVGKGGAARLAARGALRVGAGAVTVGCPPAALIENAAQLNAIMLRKVKDADALAEVLADKRIAALCLGPGLGTGEREAALVRGACEHAPYVVLDADALTLLAQDAALFAKLHANCILTPHAGEFARLFPDIAAKLDAPATKGPAYSKVDATREAAKRAGCVVLFKGPDTVIADPSGRCSINASVYERSAPWLATAGSGDVLAGFITGLLARGFAPMRAAEAGAWLHTECALKFGPGLIAEDLPEQLPAVFRDLGL